MNNMIDIPTWVRKETVENHIEALPLWLNTYRQQNWNAFIQAGIPTQKNERFKYTDFSFLRSLNLVSTDDYQDILLKDIVNHHRLSYTKSILCVFVNGRYSSLLSDNTQLPAGVILSSLSDACLEQPLLVEKHVQRHLNANAYPFACLNQSMFTDGLFVYLPKQCDFPHPLHFLFIATDKHAFIAQPYHLFVLDEGSRLTLLEEYVSFAEQPYMMNTVSHISMRKNAELSAYKIQNENHAAIHMNHTFINQQQNSHLEHGSFSFGSSFSRDELIINLNESGADCRAYGFYRLDEDKQYVDHHIEINHFAPRTNSEMLYKGIADKKSRAVFNGRLFIEKDAQKILAYQANHNLLLSNNAEVYSKPELEIYADDIKCKHGATAGQLDTDALFYLRSRGISQREAQQILMQGFLEEIIERIKHTGIQLRVKDLVAKSDDEINEKQ